MKIASTASKNSSLVAKQCFNTSSKIVTRTAQNSVRSISTSFRYPITKQNTTIDLFPKSYYNVNSVFSRQFSSGSEKTIKVPPLADSITEGTILKVIKNVGDSVKTDEIVIVIETDKITSEIRAPEDGTITNIVVKPEEVVKIGQDLFSMKPGAVAAKQEAPKESKPKDTPAQPTKEEKPQQKSEPAPSQTQSAQKSEPPKEQPKQASPSAKPVEPSGPQTVGKRGESRVRMPRMRERIAQRLKDAQNTYAMLTTFNEVDMSALMSLRDTYKEQFFEKHNGVKLGFMSAFVKAAAIALKEQPTVNAVIDGGQIVYRDHIDISVAVATPNGLVVPVLRNVEDLSFAGIEKGIADLGKKAKNNALQMEDMTGGTFTISNGGVYGSLMGTPIINPPQSAILGMHGIKERPVVVNGQIVIRPMMYLALTYDHRLIDGREAVTFLRRIISIIEDPRRILLDV